MFGRDGKSYILLTAVLAAVLILSFLLPLVGGLLQLLAGALLGVTVVKYHYRYVIATSCLMLALLALYGWAAAPDAVLMVVLANGVPMILFGLSIGIGINLKLSLYKLVLVSAMAYLVSDMALLWAMQLQSGGGNLLGDMILSTTDQAYQMMEQMYGGVLSAEELAQVKDLIGDMASLLVSLVPSMLIVVSLLVAYAGVAFVKWFLGKSGWDMWYLLSFWDIRGDRVLAIAFLVVFLLNMAGISAIVNDLTLNVICVIVALFYVFGLAFLDWWMRERGMRKTPRVLALVAVYLSAFLFALLPVLAVIGIGIADSIFDFRKRSRGNRLIQ